jgi:hypothetical protein
MFGPRPEQRQCRLLFHARQRGLRVFAPAVQSHRDDADPMVGRSGVCVLGGCHKRVDIAREHERLLKAGLDAGIEPARFSVRRQRFPVEARIPARMDEARKQFRVVAVARRGIQQPNHRARGLADVGFEIRVELMRDGQLRIQLERAIEGLSGPFHAAW